MACAPGSPATECQGKQACLRVLGIQDVLRNMYAPTATTLLQDDGRKIPVVQMEACSTP